MSELVVHWQGKPYTVAVGDPDKFTIQELKEELYRKTQVMPKRMKLLGVGSWYSEDSRRCNDKQREIEEETDDDGHARDSNRAERAL